MTVQITGPRTAIEQVLNGKVLPGAKVRDLHRLVWIEVPELDGDIEFAVRRAGCKVHNTGA